MLTSLSGPRAVIAVLFPLLIGCEEAVAPPTQVAPRTPVESVELVTPSEVVQIADTLRVQAVLRGAGGTALEGREVVWASSDTMIARVTPAGLVTGIDRGEVTITATAEEKSASVKLTVRRKAIYRVEYLGDVPGLQHSAAVAMNDAGQVVVIGLLAESPPQRPAGIAFVWRAGAFTAIAPPDSLGSATLYPVDISDAGLVGGELSAMWIGRSAFLWNRSFRMIRRLDMPETRYVFTIAVTAMNEQGDLVVASDPYCRGAGFCSGPGYLVRPTGEIVKLSFGVSDVGVPRAINDAGEIAGEIKGNTGNTEARPRGFRLNGTQLTPLPWNGSGSSATTIDTRGRTAGYDKTPDAGMMQPAFWSETGEVRRLQPLTGGNRAAVTHLNDSGLAIGFSNISPNGPELPVLYRGSETILLEEVCQQSDWVLTAAADLNERGEIVGRARHRGTGQIGAVILRPIGP